MAAFTLIGSQVNLVDGTQSLEKVSWDGNDALTPTLNLVAGTTADASWAAGVVTASLEWASTNTDTKTVTQLGKFATHLGAIGGGANIALFTASVLSEKGINGTSTALAFNASAGLFAISAAGVIFFAPEALLIMGTLNALSLAFTTMGLMTNENQTLGTLLHDFFTINPDALGTLTPMERARLIQQFGFNENDIPTPINGSLPTNGDFLPYNPKNIIPNTPTDPTPLNPKDGHPFAPLPPLQRRDPLVLDMNKDGLISTVSLADSTAFFDLTGDGIKEKVGWVSASEGIVAFDKNGNGKIDGISEVFGTATTSGFYELRQLADSNYDGVIDRRDELYNQLKVWQDANQDGISQASELKTLAEAGVKNIQLDVIGTNINLNGNLLSEAGRYTDSAGDRELAADIELTFDARVTTIDTSTIPNYTEYPESKTLPNLRGFGVVMDTSIAYNLNDTLRAMGVEYARDITKVATQFDEFIAELAGLNTMLLLRNNVENNQNYKSSRRSA